MDLVVDIIDRNGEIIFSHAGTVNRGGDFTPFVNEAMDAFSKEFPTAPTPTESGTSGYKITLRYG